MKRFEIILRWAADSLIYLQYVDDDDPAGPYWWVKDRSKATIFDKIGADKSLSLPYMEDSIAREIQ